MTGQQQTTIAAQWDSYRAEALPERMPPGREQDLKLAFYAGAIGGLTAMSLAVGDGGFDAIPPVILTLIEESKTFVLGVI